MIVLSVTNCPQQLRGDLTKWMIEIDVGVYVGNLSARVREKLWERVESNIRTGKAIMVYSSNNEQGFQIVTHNTDWMPILSEGLCLMQKPNSEMKTDNRRKLREFSKAELNLLSKRKEKEQKKEYIICAIQTVGSKNDICDVIEIGMLKIENGAIVQEFQKYIIPHKDIEEEKIIVTGITRKQLEEKGVTVKEAMEEAAKFSRNNTVVGYNIDEDMEILDIVCKRELTESFIYRSKDLVRLLKKKMDFDDLHLEYVANRCNIRYEAKKGAIETCKVLFEIISELNIF